MKHESPHAYQHEHSSRTDVHPDPQAEPAPQADDETDQTDDVPENLFERGLTDRVRIRPPCL